MGEEKIVQCIATHIFPLCSFLAMFTAAEYGMKMTATAESGNVKLFFLLSENFSGKGY